jgi:hypothetical protein
MLIRSNERGQGMTEYIIVVALIAVAATGVYALYGRVGRHQTGAIAAAVGGDSTYAQDSKKSAHTAGGQAVDEAAAKINLQNFTEPSGTK